MKERIRALSWTAEVLIVLLLAFGFTVPSSLVAIFTPDVLQGATLITNGYLHRLLAFELSMTVVLALFLRARGWTMARLSVRPTFWDSVAGLAIFVGYYGFCYVLIMTLASAFPAFNHLLMLRQHLLGQDFQWPTVVAVSVVNAIFEEVFVCSYVILSLKDRVGMTTAVNISAGIRVFYHLYQGVIGIVTVTPLALLYAYWFARTRRLWPLIIAHALTDFLALAAVIYTH